MSADDVAVTSGVVETLAARLAYDERGSGDPVVLVHSGLTDRRMWDPQMSEFGDRYRTVRYDLQGFGESEPTGPGTNRGDLLALLDGLGIDRCHLVGASFGGGVALEATLERPARVRSLTLVGPAVGGHEYEYEDESPTWKRVETLYERAAAAFEAGDLQRAADLEVELWVVGPGRSPEAVDPTIREWVAELDLAALEGETAGRQRPDATDLDPPAVDRFGDLTVPTLVVVGEYDLPHVHAAARRLEREVPGVQRVVFEETAHFPSLERPTAFTNRVLGFIETV